VVSAWLVSHGLDLKSEPLIHLAHSFLNLHKHENRTGLIKYGTVYPSTRVYCIYVIYQYSPPPHRPIRDVLGCLLTYDVDILGKNVGLFVVF